MTWTKTKAKTERVCPRCQTVFEDTTCPNCKWSAKDVATERKHYCVKCHAVTLIRYKDQWVCVDCYQDELGKPENYEFTATREQVAKWLIKQGSKSIYWQKATEEQRLDAIRYYKEGAL
jgi:hypothetical protein